MRLSPKAFWKLTPVAFSHLSRAFHRAGVARWQHTRFLAATLINLNRDPKSPPYALADVLPLPGDPRPEPPRLLTAEESLAQQQLLDELDKDLVL